MLLAMPTSSLAHLYLSLMWIVYLWVKYRRWSADRYKTSRVLNGVSRQCLQLGSYGVTSLTLSFWGTVNVLLFLMDLSFIGSGSSSPTLSILSLQSVFQRQKHRRNEEKQAGIRRTFTSTHSGWCDVIKRPTERFPGVWPEIQVHVNHFLVNCNKMGI